ncbi:hypothetical protein PRUPE_1G537000 [Prunus persica]|uniref:Uncharacterized protein n=1 Tax=Prunus persica TaxID=3760 RepID=A0A251RHG6_PRUPE|nr:hypothetical protein PRUPE_1G537000 [Prunus persica]
MTGWVKELLRNYCNKNFRKLRSLVAFGRLLSLHIIIMRFDRLFFKEISIIE